MEERKKTIIIDIDGTFFDTFAEKDKCIIYGTFYRNIFVRFIDFILQVLNSFDMVTNSMWILLTRLYIYSMLSPKRSYHYIKREYRALYHYYFKECYDAKYDLLCRLSEKYKLVFITNNEFSMKSKFAKDYVCMYAEDRYERKKLVADILKTRDVCYFIGNNFMDDYLIAKRNFIPFLYVGKSKIMEYFSKTKGFKSFSDAVDSIC